MQQSVAAYLVIQSGNRWSDILRLRPDQSILVGRSSECEIVVRNDRVSRKHAEITPHNGGWSVRDLGSRNGTLVNRETIQELHRLRDGETIDVGGCRITFTMGLSGIGKAPGVAPGGATEATREIPPTIVNRIANSQWSSEGIAPVGATSRNENADQWGFFYRLIAELVTTESRETAAQLALERLVSQLGLSFGGVIHIDAKAKSVQSSMAILATYQPKGESYRRISDFLVETVSRDAQAVLARNVQDDSQLALEQASASRDVVSIICAPLKSAPDKDGNQSITGLLHIYTAGNERMLTDVDLELAVGVADNLSIALAKQEHEEDLSKRLASSRRRIAQLQEQLDESLQMVGESAALTQVKQSIERAGPTDATVLIRGESGVGKELVARAMHAMSKRSTGPLICLNCAALAPTLLESELFGHEKGAFTGATERKIGKFEAADGGTLLLDEIGEMSPELQAKFLRVLEGQPFERLGGNKSIKTDVRVLAATNRDLEEAVQEKEFRADLFFRLRVIEVYVPPLRERKEDIQPLVHHFIAQLKHHAGRRLNGIAAGALERLGQHDWPGNIRELRNVIERAVVLGGEEEIVADDLSLVTLSTESPTASPTTGTSAFSPISLAELEKKHIFAMLEHTEGNKTKAAQLLGIERSTLDRKLKRY
ncbi:MAG: sigma 54-interacting transcriptional regulator [Planctomycetota bacterium]